MLRKIAILFPVLAFALPLVAASLASAGDPWQVGKHDQVWPDTPTYPDQWEPVQYDQIDQGKPIGPDCSPVQKCPPPTWDCADPDGNLTPCPCQLINPCTGEIVGELPDLPDLPDMPFQPDEFDL